MLDTLSILGQFFTRFLSPVLDAIRESNIGAGLAFLVLLGGFLVFVFAIWRHFQDRRLLNKAEAVLDGVESEADFVEKFQTISQDMEQIPIIGPAWSEFCETLVQPKRGRDGALVPASNTIRPHVFFNTNDLPIGPKFLTVWPNIFVGIGLTITFLGLISALTQASTSMGEVAGDPQQVQYVVQNLSQRRLSKVLRVSGGAIRVRNSDSYFATNIDKHQYFSSLFLIIASSRE